MIQETSLLSATDADALSVGRFNSIPFSGVLILEFQAQLADASNSWALTIALPGGDVPVDAQLVPACNPALAGVLDERTLLRYAFRVGMGGHVTVSLTETGTNTVIFRATLTP